MTEKPIPNYVDDQMQIFMWEVDEFFPSLVIFMVMFMWDQLLLGIILTILFVKLFQGSKARTCRAYCFTWFGGRD